MDLWNINRNSYALYRIALFPMTLSDPELHQAGHFSIFCIAFSIFVVGRDSDFKLGRQVDGSKC